MLGTPVTWMAASLVGGEDPRDPRLPGLSLSLRGVCSEPKHTCPAF